MVARVLDYDAVGALDGAVAKLRAGLILVFALWVEGFNGDGEGCGIGDCEARVGWDRWLRAGGRTHDCRSERR